MGRSKIYTDSDTYKSRVAAKDVFQKKSSENSEKIFS